MPYLEYKIRMQEKKLDMDGETRKQEYCSK